MSALNPRGFRPERAPLVWQVVWVGADERGHGACGHRHGSVDEATLCPFEPPGLPEVCAGLVRQVRDPDYRTPREGLGPGRDRKRARARQLELELG